MLHILAFIIICGLIWELIDRIKPKHNIKQWSKEEREILDKQEKPPLKINRIEPSYTEEYLRNEERISATNAIKSDIILDFYRNFRYREEKNPKDDYMESVVEYGGKRTYIRFYDWKQNPLRKLASYLYEDNR